MLLQLVEPGQTPDPHSTPKGVVVGIDLGTTHSVVAYVQEGKPRVIPFEGQRSLLPSTLSITEEGFKVGDVSKNSLSSTKRLMGREKGLRLTLGSHKLSPVEVAGHILEHVKDHVEKTLGCPLEAAVITVPAYFDEAARVATKQAAALAGIKTLRLINEPTAAALAYGLETGAEGIYAIYDFGGGTFDISLLKLKGNVFQVLGTGGDLSLGGDDIDHALLTHHKLSDVREARFLKEQLSQEKVYEGVTREALETLAAPFVEKTLTITQNVLRDAKISLQEICGIVLVGGMTRMPLVKQQVTNFFGQKLLCDIDPDQTVSLGAALVAHGLTHGSDTLLLDLTPLSLGLETMGGLVEKIIPRNTPLPALASQEFTTHEDGQGGMIIHVVQGEREFVSDCLSLAQFELKGLPPLSAGAARVRVDFSIDVEGLLTVSAFEKTTGLSQHIEIRPSHGLDEKTIAQIVMESQKFGKEDIQKRFDIEETQRIELNPFTKP